MTSAFCQMCTALDFFEFISSQTPLPFLPLFARMPHIYKSTSARTCVTECM